MGDQETLVESYFRIYKEQLKEKNAPIALLMQAGDFYEMYAYHNEDTDEWYGSNLYELKDILRCNKITVKSGLRPNYRGDKPSMWGFPISVYDTYCNLLSSENYIVIRMDQVKDNKGKVIDRPITEQVTPGTYISRLDDLYDTESNNISCLYLNKYYDKSKMREKISYGYSNINSYTGDTDIFEGKTESMYMDSTILNDLDRYFINNNPKEILLVSNLSDKEKSKINNCLGISDCLIRDYKSDDAVVKNILKIGNIEDVICRIFGDKKEFFCELEWYHLGTTSLVFLIEYVNKYNPLSVNKLNLPKYECMNNKVLLENHTLQQLNIVDDLVTSSKIKKRTSSLINFLNNCLTMSGKRLLKEAFINPTRDIDYLNKEYAITDKILKNYEILDTIRPYLKKVSDVNYILRKIMMDKGCPNDLYKLFNSLFQLLKILNNENVLNILKDYLDDKFESILDKKDKLKEILNNIENMVNIKECSILTITVDDLNIIKKGYSTVYDSLVYEFNRNNELFENTIIGINDFIRKYTSKSDNYVKEHVKPKEPSEIHITETRRKAFNSALNFLGKNEKMVVYYDNKKSSVEIDLSTIEFKKSTKTNYSVYNEIITTAANKVNDLRHKLLGEVKEIFSNILSKVCDTYFDDIYELSNILGTIDLLICKAYNSKKYNYCRPTIIKEKKSYFDVKDLRHPLIEQINDNEKYVTNDLLLGKEKNGLLLFGTNAVGKTSCIRAIGMIMIMAQAGMYVPASQLIYSPYSKIYSRILGNDNLFKNMSTYQVELSELRPIIHYSDNNSLVLGDELCSGTEHPSALSVNAAGIISLNKSGPTYIFATHYHDLVDWKEIKELKGLSIKHMSVIYNKESEELIYERKFRDGEGDRSYGLEVLKSAHFNNDFVKDCYDLYNKYFKNIEHRVSRYNSKLIKPEVCELCKNEPPVDTHHILEQKDADANGIIKFQHKNHKSNLIWLCKNCHLKQTDENDRWKIVKKVKTTNGYKLELKNGSII